MEELPQCLQQRLLQTVSLSFWRPADQSADQTSSTTGPQRSAHADSLTETQLLSSSNSLPKDAEVDAKDQIRPIDLAGGAEWVQLGYQTIRESSKLAAVCKDWSELAKSSSLWQEVCDLVWQGRYVPKHLRELSQTDSRHAFAISLQDTSRVTMTMEEITSFEWNFRFKSAAGPQWHEFDPFWQGQPASKVRYNQDGTTTRNNPMMAGFDITWRWGNSKTRTPASGTPCPRVQATVSGRDVPSYTVSRHPVHAHFLMQSCWTLHAAFPMPRGAEDPYMTDQELEVTFARQSREALEHNLRITGEDIRIEDVVGNEVIMNIAGIRLQVPHDVGEALAASGLPGQTVLHLLRRRFADDEGEGSSDNEPLEGESFRDGGAEGLENGEVEISGGVASASQSEP